MALAPFDLVFGVAPCAIEAVIKPLGAAGGDVGDGMRMPSR